MIQREDIIHAVRPLRWIFWGALLVVLDLSLTLTVGGNAFEFDLLDDTVGLLLITAAVGRLRHIPVDSLYARRMRRVYWVSILMLLESVAQHFIDLPGPLGLLSTVLQVAAIVAILSFCARMRDLCHAALLPEAALAWRRTFRFFLILHAIPVGLLLLAGLVMGGLSFQGEPGLAMWLLGALLLAPLVSFFRTTSAMARSAASMPASSPEAAPLPLAAALHG